MRIFIETKPQGMQRYDTTGDWQWSPAPSGLPYQGDHLHVSVSELGDWRLEALVGVHELIEAILCKNDGVSDTAVTDFDLEFERERAAAPLQAGHFTFRRRAISIDAEPGDDIEAPYRQQHCIATAAERMLCAALGVSWSDYENAVLNLGVAS